jgi:glycosyltransferase involved in cell wall biosynthesis
MRIAQIAPLQLTVPPQNYGGTERCIYNITEALVEAGHDVTLFATAGSQTSAHLVPMRSEPIRFSTKVDSVALYMAMLRQVYQRADEFDVIHSHLDYLTLPYAAASKTPTAITLHGRLDAMETAGMFRAFRECNYVAISNSQRLQIPELNWVATIHHAVDLRPITFAETPGSYLVFVGRITPEKGPDRAIKIARKVGIPLKIAAKVDPSERKYYEEVIKPMLGENDPLIEFLGPVNERRKQELMQNALALLLPINWPEPFGMVFIEALACGTPVLTCPHGSVPELLQDGVTGYIRETDDELVEAARAVAAIDRASCREHVRQRFDIREMALKYVDVYAKIQQRRLFAMLPEAPSDDAVTPSQTGTLDDLTALDQSSLIS